MVTNNDNKSTLVMEYGGNRRTGPWTGKPWPYGSPPPGSTVPRFHGSTAGEETGQTICKRCKHEMQKSSPSSPLIHCTRSVKSSSAEIQDTESCKGVQVEMAAGSRSKRSTNREKTWCIFSCQQRSTSGIQKRKAKGKLQKGRVTWKKPSGLVNGLVKHVAPSFAAA
jgi:hypothetical protein